MLTMRRRIHNRTARGMVRLGALLLVLRVGGGALHAGEIEAGRTDLPQTVDEAHHVEFDQSFERTPLIFTMPTDEGADPAALRVRNVTADGFDVMQVEPAGEDGTHDAMTDVSYIAVEPGRHELAPGVTVEAFTVRTDATISNFGGGGYDTTAFREAFDNTPAVIAGIQTMNNEANDPPPDVSSPWLTPTLLNIQNDQFDVSLERAEVNDGGAVNQTERVAYLAIDIDTANVTDSDGNAVAFEALFSGNSIDDGASAVNFNQAFANAPLVVAVKTTRDGNNGSWLRLVNVNAGQVTLRVQEDRFSDGETNHTTEQAALLAFAQAFRAELTSSGRTHTWQGAGATWDNDTNWDNWDGDRFNLATGDQLIFDDTGDATTTTQVTQAHEARLDALTFQGDTAYTIDADNDGTLQLHTGARIDNRTAHTQTLDVPLVAHGSALTLDAGDTDGGALVLDPGATVDLVDGGRLTITGDNHTTLHGAVNGADGTLHKSDAGTLTLTGENTYTGQTTVNDGTLALAGSIDGDLTNRARLEGAGTIGDGDDTLRNMSGAQFAPGGSIGVTTVNGDLQQAAGSTLEIEIDADIDPIAKGSSHDAVDVTGSATLDANSIIDLQLSNRDGLEEGDTFTIIDANDGVTDNGALINAPTDNVRFIISEAFNNGDSQYPLVATYDFFTHRAVGENNRATASGLWRLAATRPGGAAERALLEPMRNMTSDAAFNRALRELNAEPYDVPAVTNITRAQHYSTSLGQYLSARRERRPAMARGAGRTRAGDTMGELPMLASREPSPTMLRDMLRDTRSAQPASRPRPQSRPRQDALSAFATGWHITDDQDTTSRHPGYVARTHGGMVGIDARADDESAGNDLLVGLGFGAARTDTDFAAGRGGVVTDSVRLGPYASWQRDAWFVDASVTYGYHDNDTTRRVPTLGLRMTGDHDAHDLASHLSTGYEMQWRDWRITPVGSLHHVYYKADAFTESGRAGALRVDEHTVQSLRSRVGARIATTYELDQVTLIPEAAVGWEHEWLNNPRDVEARFTAGGGPFDTETITPNEDALLLGAGLTGLIHDHVAAHVSYQGRFANTGQVHAASLGVEVSF